MKPLMRKRVHKGRSARRFRKQSRRTKGANLRSGVMRGGYRL